MTRISREICCAKQMQMLHIHSCLLRQHEYVVFVEVDLNTIMAKHFILISNVTCGQLPTVRKS